MITTELNVTDTCIHNVDGLNMFAGSQTSPFLGQWIYFLWSKLNVIISKTHSINTDDNKSIQDNEDI